MSTYSFPDLNSISMENTDKSSLFYCASELITVEVIPDQWEQRGQQLPHLDTIKRM